MNTEEILEAMMSIVTGSDEHKKIMRKNLRMYAEAVSKELNKE